MRSPTLPLLLAAVTAGSLVSAYKVSISSEDNSRQVCSGMFAGKRKGGEEGEKARIEVTFEPSSSGQIALVIYEWSDVQYLGAITPSIGSNIEDEDYLPKTYICTTSAVRSHLCDPSALGEFIVVLPTSTTLNDTSIFTQGLRFRDSARVASLGRRQEDEDDEGEAQDEGEADYDELLDDGGETEDDGIPMVTGIRHGKGAAAAKATTTTDTLPPTATPTSTTTTTKKKQKHKGKHSSTTLSSSASSKTKKAKPTTTAQKEAAAAEPTSIPTTDEEAVDEQQEDTSSGTPWYDGGIISYELKKTGYYCIGTVPVTLLSSKRDQVEPVLEVRAAAPLHAEYKGEVAFLNIFQGELPAGDWPKINFYMALTALYLLITIGWGFLCFKYRSDLLPIQNYVSGTLIYIFVEMFVYFVYYRYINHHGFGSSSTAFLLVVAILNAGRNSLSFFLLLVVSMGLSVVTPTLGTIMRRIRFLTIAHFIFGVIYSIGTVEISLETASLLLILSLIAGLSFTLTSFLMWTVISLNGTIMHLEKRKQKHKLQMFKRLYRILMAAVLAIGAFFVISTISLSDRQSEDYAPNNWKIRWFLLDGSLSLIYLGAFVSIAFLWRPTGNNMRLAMSEELAQDEDEADAEDYELSRRADDEDEGGPLRPDHPDEEDSDDDEVKRTRKEQASAAGGVEDNRVVFALDDDEDDEEDDETPKPRRQKKDSEEGYDVNEREEAGEGERLVAGASGSSSKRAKDD